jgi:hypothetical protein
MTDKELAPMEQKPLVDTTEWDALAGAGYEETKTDDYSRNFVYVLQSLSPTVRERRMYEGNFYIPGLDLEINRDPGLNFVPVYSQQRFVEWAPNRGGFISIYDSSDQVVLDARENGEWGAYTTKEGNDLVQTFYLFAMAELYQGSWAPVCFPITSTKIRHYTGLRSKLNLLKLPSGKPYPLFAHVCRATTAKETKAGNEYYNIRFSLAAPAAVDCRVNSRELLESAKEFYKVCAAGKAEIDYSASREDESIAPVEHTESGF